MGQTRSINGVISPLANQVPVLNGKQRGIDQGHVHGMDTSGIQNLVSVCSFRDNVNALKGIDEVSESSADQQVIFCEEEVDHVIRLFLFILPEPFATMVGSPA